jgi:hypothetical protein
MSFDWGEYINLADTLISNNPAEAELRSAVSRAYYGTFNQCRIYKGYNTKTFDIHQKVISEFKTSDSTEEMTIGNHLDSLRIVRNDADYNGFYKPQISKTKNHIILSKKVIELLKQIKD